MRVCWWIICAAFLIVGAASGDDIANIEALAILCSYMAVDRLIERIE